jgi:hypothetical protein
MSDSWECGSRFGASTSPIVIPGSCPYPAERLPQRTHNGSLTVFGHSLHNLWHRARYWLAIAALMAWSPSVFGADAPAAQAEKLLKAGQELAERTHYLEALDVLEEARDQLEAAGATQSALYGDVLYVLAETKLKGRLHQRFPAQYVKTALKDVQISNKLRERLSNILPRKLAEGYFVEGYVQKTFFKRNREAKICFEKALSADAGFAAARRELGELILEDGQKQAERP